MLTTVSTVVARQCLLQLKHVFFHTHCLLFDQFTKDSLDISHDNVSCLDSHELIVEFGAEKEGEEHRVDVAGVAYVR